MFEPANRVKSSSVYIPSSLTINKLSFDKIKGFEDKIKERRSQIVLASTVSEEEQKLFVLGKERREREKQLYFMEKEMLKTKLDEHLKELDERRRERLIEKEEYEALQRMMSLKYQIEKNEKDQIFRAQRETEYRKWRVEKEKRNDEASTIY
jgi:hypothetical protein